MTVDMCGASCQVAVVFDRFVSKKCLVYENRE